MLVGKYTLIVVVPDWSYVEMRKINSPKTVMAVSLSCLMLCIMLNVSGCGNKGDLYLEADAASVEELEKAAEKLKQNKKPAN